MSSLRRRPIRRRDDLLRELTEAQTWNLLLGAAPFPHAFKDERSRRAAWFLHRDTLLAECNAGSRPEGWWDYEQPNKRQAGERNLAALLRLGLLTDAERQFLKIKE
jgi:hypothetical protein